MDTRADTINKVREDRRIAVYLFICFTAIYLLCASGLNFYHIDVSLLRIEVANSLIERDNLTVPENYGIRGIDGKNYSWFGLGSVLIAVPFYISAKCVGALPENAVAMINQIISAATVVLIFRFLSILGYPRRTSLFVCLFYGLGTMAFPASKHPFDHPVETFFVLSSVYCMYRYATGKRFSYLIFSSLSLGVAFITRYTSILVLPALFIMAFIYYLPSHDVRSSLRHIIKDLIVFFSALFPFIVLVLWYNNYRFGSLFETGYSLYASRSGLDLFTGTPLYKGIFGFLISPGKGFFFYSPVAALYFFSIRGFLKKHMGIAICFIFIIIAYLLFLSKNLFWHGDWAWGPRYLIVITPFVVLPIVDFLSNSRWIKRKYVQVAVILIFSLSFLIQLAAVSVDFQKYFVSLYFQKPDFFIIVNGEGVPPFIEPAPETYFDCAASPILSQFKFLYRITREINHYEMRKIPENAPLSEKMLSSPYMHIFDFWWVYNYLVYNSYSALIVALLFILLAVYSLFRLFKFTSTGTLMT